MNGVLYTNRAGMGMKTHKLEFVGMSELLRPAQERRGFSSETKTKIKHPPRCAEQRKDETETALPCCIPP